MITQNRYDLGDMSFQGLSTDTKPTLAPVNSLFLELDTKTLYYCSSGGSESEETVFDDTVELSTQINSLSIGVITLADTIDVVFDGVEYNNIPNVRGSYGAPWDESTQSVDYSTYPFRVIYGGSYTSFIEPGEVGEHSFTIISNGETVAEGTHNFLLHGYGSFTGFEPAETITVTLNGTEYVCTKQVHAKRYGAPRNEETGQFDYSEFPFILYSYGSIETVGIEGECSLTIVATVKTEAVWTKYGEAPSGGIVGDLSEGVTIRESDWIDRDGVYYVQVEPYPLVGGTSYKIYSTMDGETAVDTQQAQKSELDPEVSVDFFNGALQIVYLSSVNETYICTNSNPEVTLTLEQGGRE